MFNVCLTLLFVACLGVGFAGSLSAGEPSISPVVLTDAEESAPSIAAPEPNATTTAVAAPRSRAFSQADLLELLARTLQKDYIKDQGELELRLSNPWPTRTVPDETLSIRILDLPRTGLASSFLIRFELRTPRELVGTYQIAGQARIWREVWIARSILKRGDTVADADIERQRRDVLSIHEALADFTAGDSTIEMAEPLQAGSPLLSRSVRLRPVIRRGQTADAVVQDGALSISMKVEALEDGAPGQTIRARNSQSRRDIRGKVLNEQTILISL